MRRIKHWPLWLCLTASFVQLQAAHVAAEPAWTRLTNSVPIEAVVAGNSHAGMAHGYPAASLTCEGTRFGWLLPGDFRAEQVNADSLMLSSDTRDRFIKVRVLAGLKGGGMPDVPLLGELVAGRQPSAVLRGPFERSAGGGSGVAFDLQWPFQGSSQTARIVFVASPAGVVEFSLVCHAGAFDQGLNDLNMMLTTLTVAEDGAPLDMPLLSDRL